MRDDALPDPSAARDPAAFVALLRDLREWSGRPSLRELRRLGGVTTAVGGETVDALPASTISYVLLGKRLPLLPRRSFVDAYVSACLLAAGWDAGAAAPVVERWTAVWRALRQGEPVAGASTLPRDVPDFTGRAGPLAEILRHLRGGSHATRVIALGGMPGVGKTALAVRAAHLLAADFDLALFAGLGGASPLGALTALLRASGAEPPACLEAAVAAWRTRTRTARALVVLDDCADAALAEPLLPSGPGCAVIVTSRHRLTGLDGAVAMSLPCLPGDETLTLLARIVGEERVRREPEAAAALAARTGGLPLAVRLLGARLRHRPQWPLSGLVPIEPHRLADGDRGVAAAFGASHDTLPETAASVYRLSGLHPGEFGLDAAAALTGRPEPEVWADLEVLVDAHLLEQTGPGRYRMHPVAAAHAAALADERGERRAAVLRLLNAVGAAHREEGAHGEAVEAWQRALGMCGEGTPEAGLVLDNLGAGLLSLGRFAESAACHLRAAGIWGGRGDARREAGARRGLGRALAGAGRHREAVSAHAEAERLLRGLGEDVTPGAATTPSPG